MTRGLKKPCLECGTLTTAPSRCPSCARQHRLEHRDARARAAPAVNRGAAICSRCGQPIQSGEKWEIDRRFANGHLIAWQPSHKACNRAARGVA